MNSSAILKRWPRSASLNVLSSNRLVWIGGGMLFALVLLAIFAPLISPYDPLQQDIIRRLNGPSSVHWLGTDKFGRDVLSRLIYGARISLTIAFLSIMLAMVVGTVVGILAGYIGGLFERVVMAVADMLQSFPSLLLGLIIVAMLGASLQNLVIAIAVAETAPFTRVARAPTIAAKRRDYVEAGRALGFSPIRIMALHIFPNIQSEIIVIATLWMASAIRTAAALSFIGLGVSPPTPTWGAMIHQGFSNIASAWWLVVFPSLAILITVLALNILGDALRDMLDPHLRND